MIQGIWHNARFYGRVEVRPYLETICETSVCRDELCAEPEIGASEVRQRSLHLRGWSAVQEDARRRRAVTPNEGDQQEPVLVVQRLDKRDVILPFSPKLIEGGPISLLEFSLE